MRLVKIILYIIIAFVIVSCISGCVSGNIYNTEDEINDGIDNIYYQHSFVNDSTLLKYQEIINVAYGNEIGAYSVNVNSENAYEITQGEAIALSVSTYYSLNYDTMPEFEYTENDVWYSPFIKEKSVITNKDVDAENLVDCKSFVQYMAEATEGIYFEEINYIDDGTIPGVEMESDYSDMVYTFYRTGIYTGIDENGTFDPYAPVTRGEALEIIARILDPSLRQSIELIGEY